MSTGNETRPAALAEDAAIALTRVVPAVYRVLRTVLARRFPEASSVPQIRVLFRLSNNSNLSLKDLAESERVSPPTMSRSIGTLLAKGWVTRTSSREDRRCVSIALTREGSSLVEQVVGELNLQFAALLGSWDDESLDVLIRALTLLENSSILDLDSISSLGPVENDHRKTR